MKQKIKAAAADISDHKKEKCSMKKDASAGENAPKAPKEPKAPKKAEKKEETATEAPEEAKDKPAETCHHCHNKVHKLIQEAVLKVNKPREAL